MRYYLPTSVSPFRHQRRILGNARPGNLCEWHEGMCCYPLYKVLSAPKLTVGERLGWRSKLIRQHILGAELPHQVVTVKKILRTNATWPSTKMKMIITSIRAKSGLSDFAGLTRKMVLMLKSSFAGVISPSKLYMLMCTHQLERLVVSLHRQCSPERALRNIMLHRKAYNSWIKTECCARSHTKAVYY